MKKCSGCTGCSSAQGIHKESSGHGRKSTVPDHSAIVIIGNRMVGKTALFVRVTDSDMSGKKGNRLQNSFVKGYIGDRETVIYDTPGTASLFSDNPEASVAKDLILSGAAEDGIGNILVVGDSKNLRRSVALTLQYAEYGLPMLLVLNMADEAARHGISIDREKLSDLLGMVVCETIARDGTGTGYVVSQLARVHVPEKTVTCSEPIEQFLAIVEKLLSPERISARAVGLLLLTGDTGIGKYLENRYSSETVAQLFCLLDEIKREETEDTGVTLSKLYMKKAQEIAGKVQQVGTPSPGRFAFNLGSWCMNPWSGIPIAVSIMALMYVFVGSFGATFLVDTLNTTLFEGFLIPKVNRLIEPIPWIFIKEMIADPDFGILTTGVFLALGLVLPVLFCFYIAFGVLEDSGYLSRLAVLLDRVLKGIGLNGKGVIPLVMGFSCVTMAILTTRLLDTKKEKNIASFLLLLGMPCAPLLAVMFIILDKMSVSATLTVFGLIFFQILIAGFFANRILSGVKSPLIMELQPMRLPRPGRVLKMSVLKTYCFIKEALPVFILASLVVFLFERAGGLAALERISEPLISGFMGLPEKSVRVFIKTIIRRESGATEIQHLAGIYDNVQLVVNLLVMTFLSPCINATIVLIKERGLRTAVTIITAVMIYAIFIGSIVNHTCRFFGVTFT